MNQIPNIEVNDIVEAALDILHEAIQHTPIKLSETNGTEYDKGYIFYQDMVVRDVLDNTPKLKQLLTEGFHQQLQKALAVQAIQIREEEANEYNKIIERELQKAREESGKRNAVVKEYKDEGVMFVLKVEDGKTYEANMPIPKWAEVGKLKLRVHSELDQEVSK